MTGWRLFGLFDCVVFLGVMCFGIFYVISMIIFDGLLITLSKTGSLSQQLAYLSLGFNLLDGECDVFKVVI